MDIGRTIVEERGVVIDAANDTIRITSMWTARIIESVYTAVAQSMTQRMQTAPSKKGSLK